MTIRHISYVMCAAALVIGRMGFATVSPIQVEFSVTAVSAVAPELHILLTNKSDTPSSYRIEIEEVSGDRLPSCVINASHSSALRQERPWMVRRERADGVSGSISANGQSHRVHAFGHAGSIFPCVARVDVRAAGSVTSRVLTIDRYTAAAGPTIDAPEVSAHSWAERDFGSSDVLLHTVVRNRSPFAAKIAILRRELTCPEREAKAYWSLINSVPQGLESGPVALEAGQWVGFVNVVHVEGGAAAGSCFAELHIAHERTPTGYKVVETSRVPIKPDSSWSWSVPETAERDE